MLKKSFSTVGCMGLTYDQIISLCKKHCMEGIEIRMDNDDTVCGCKSEEELRELKQAMSESKIKITNLGSSVCFMGYEKEKLQNVFKAIDIASIVECNAVRIFLGNFSRKVNPDLPNPDYNGIVEALGECCDYAKKHNSQIWVETHNEFATGKTLSKLVSDVNSPHLGIIWDIIHPIEDGESIQETWNYIGDHVSHIHIKDGKKRLDKEWHDYEYTCLGEGELPIESIINLAEKNGYKGFYSLEWESLWREELKLLDISFDNVLEQYAGFMKGAVK